MYSRITVNFGEVILCWCFISFGVLAGRCKVTVLIPDHCLHFPAAFVDIDVSTFQIQLQLSSCSFQINFGSGNGLQYCVKRGLYLKKLTKAF